MNKVNLLKKATFLLLTVLISLNFTSCSQDEDLIKDKEERQEPPITQLTVGQTHNMLLDRALKRIKETPRTRSNDPNSFFTTPVSIACAEIRSHLIETADKELDKLELQIIDETMLAITDKAIDIAEERLIISETKEPKLSDLIDMNDYSYADKLIMQLLENTISKEYNSVQEKISDINLLKGISSTEEVNNMIDIAASSLEYWDANLDDWVEVIMENNPGTRANRYTPNPGQLVLADVSGFKSGAQEGALIGAYVGATAGTAVGPGGTIGGAAWGAVEGAAYGALSGCVAASAVDGIVQTFYWLKNILCRDKVVYYDNGKEQVTSKVMKATLRDDYVTIIWDN